MALIIQAFSIPTDLLYHFYCLTWVLYPPQNLYFLIMFLYYYQAHCLVKYTFIELS